jgi:hypothetical protein
MLFACEWRISNFDMWKHSHWIACYKYGMHAIALDHNYKQNCTMSTANTVNIIALSR